MITITTLIENSQGEHLALKIEHGVSFFVDTGDHAVLFDTGQSGTFISNAAQLRINLARIGHVVLSHGHYDHSGGLRSLLEVHRGFELVVGQGFFNEKWAEKNGSYEYLGNNFDEAFLKAARVRYSQLADPVRELVPGVYVVGHFPRIHTDEPINPRFKLRQGTSFESDSFDDEVMLVVDTPKGLVALLGCSHPGMRTMLDAVRERFDKPLYAVLGGTHLVEASQDGMRKSIDYLEHSGMGAIGVSHCTGAGAMKILGETEKRYFHNRTGCSLIV